MKSFLKDRIKTQWDLYKNSVERSNSFFCGVLLFAELLFYKTILRIKTKKILNYWDGSSFDFKGIKLTGKGKANPSELKNIKYSYEDIFLRLLRQRTDMIYQQTETWI